MAFQAATGQALPVQSLVAIEEMRRRPALRGNAAHVPSSQVSVPAAASVGGLSQKERSKGREYTAESCSRCFFFDRHRFPAYRLTPSSGGRTGAGPWASQTQMMRRASSPAVTSVWRVAVSAIGCLARTDDQLPETSLPTSGSSVIGMNHVGDKAR